MGPASLCWWVIVSTQSARLPCLVFSETALLQGLDMFRCLLLLESLSEAEGGYNEEEEGKEE